MNKNKTNILNIDIFLIFNLVLFIWLCTLSPFELFPYYHSEKSITEFFISAIAIMITMIVGWRLIRTIRIPSILLVFIQIVIIMHFAGGLVNIEHHRLYDHFFCKIRYDKYVHVIGAFAGGLVLFELYIRQLNITLWLKDFQLILVNLGIGAIFEIFEYLITLMFKINGVGGYDNNMQDLISNFIGSIIALIVIKITDKIKMSFIK